MKWFGLWDMKAPIRTLCEAADKFPSKCYVCEKELDQSDVGVVLPLMTHENTVEEVSYHRDCLAKILGIKVPRQRVRVGVPVIREEVKLIHQKTSSIYVVYEKPEDLPDDFVVRRWDINGTGYVPTEWVKTAPTLDEVRQKVPEGLVWIERHLDDDLCVVGSYV